MIDFMNEVLTRPTEVEYIKVGRYNVPLHAWTMTKYVRKDFDKLKGLTNIQSVVVKEKGKPEEWAFKDPRAVMEDLV